MQFCFKFLKSSDHVNLYTWHNFTKCQKHCQNVICHFKRVVSAHHVLSWWVVSVFKIMKGNFYFLFFACKVLFYLISNERMAKTIVFINCTLFDNEVISTKIFIYNFYLVLWYSEVEISLPSLLCLNLNYFLCFYFFYFIFFLRNLFSLFFNKLVILLLFYDKILDFIRKRDYFRQLLSLKILQIFGFMDWFEILLPLACFVGHNKAEEVCVD